MDFYSFQHCTLIGHTQRRTVIVWGYIIYKSHVQFRPIIGVFPISVYIFPVVGKVTILTGKINIEIEKTAYIGRNFT